MLTVGIKGLYETEVNANNTASSIGSGLLDVFSTPAMIAGMELAASESVQKYLEDGLATVGASLNIKHVSATPLGMTVRIESELIETDGKRLVFKVTAYDGQGLIGEGVHERFIIKINRFMEKAAAKQKTSI